MAGEGGSQVPPATEPLADTKPFIIPAIPARKKRPLWRAIFSVDGFLVAFLIALAFLMAHSLAHRESPSNYSWNTGFERQDIATVVEEDHGDGSYEFSRWFVIDNTVELKACLLARGEKRTVEWMFPASVPYFKVENKSTDEVWYYHGDELLCVSDSVGGKPIAL